jgi:hypothetical protein
MRCGVVCAGTCPYGIDEGSASTTGNDSGSGQQTASQGQRVGNSSSAKANPRSLADIMASRGA